jgi:chemotaxis signal transduction protein
MLADEPFATGRLLAFRVGGGRFAVPLDEVLGVQNLDRSGVVSGGAVAFHGRPVPAVDARALGWGGEDFREAASDLSAVIVGRAGTTTALIVDHVEGIVEGSTMGPLPGLLAPFVRGFFRGVALHAEGWRLVVDPTSLPAAAGRSSTDNGRGGSGEA